MDPAQSLILSYDMKNLFLVALIILSVIVLKGIKKKDNPIELWQALDKKASTAFQNYEIEKACKYWLKALKEKPDNLKIYNKLGIAYLLVKDYNQAIDILKKGLDIDDTSPGLNYNLALTYYYAGYKEKTLKQLEKVLALESSYPDANYLKGLCYEDTGRMEDARKAYTEELNNNPGSRRAWKKAKQEL